jgi:hypothetical protein
LISCYYLYLRILRYFILISIYDSMDLMLCVIVKFHIHMCSWITKFRYTLSDSAIGWGVTQGITNFGTPRKRTISHTLSQNSIIIGYDYGSLVTLFLLLTKITDWCIVCLVATKSAIQSSSLFSVHVMFVTCSASSLSALLESLKCFKRSCIVHS